MRKLLALLLLASVATPALAAGDRPGRRQESGTEAKSEDRGDRSDRSERVQGDRGNRAGDDNNGGHSQPVIRVQSRDDGANGGGNDHQPTVTRVETNNGRGQSAEPRFHNGFRGRFSSGGQVQAADQGNGGGGEPAVQRVRREESGSNDTVRTFRGPRVITPDQVTLEDRSAPVLRQPTRPLPRVLRDRVPIVSTTPREGTQPPLRAENRRRGAVHWSTTNWRSDRRYDWREHRRRNRSIFHLGIYLDPFNWGYRPYQIGWRLWPSYYRSSFWINDPWQYRLPYAPPGYRWIRYYDDALLVDTWNGEVVDVIYNFFW